MTSHPSRNHIISVDGKNFATIDCGGGGACLFRCLAIALKIDSDIVDNKLKEPHQIAREDIVNYVCNKWEIVYKDWVRQILDKQSQESYKRYMSVVTEYGSLVEVHAASEKYEVDIYVVRKNFDSSYFLVPFKNDDHVKDPIYILFTGQISGRDRDGHCQLLIEQNDADSDTKEPNETSSTSAPIGLNSEFKDAVQLKKELNNSKDELERMNILKELRKLFENITDDEFINILCQDMNWNKSHFCDYCFETFNTYYQTVEHNIVQHKMNFKLTDSDSKYQNDKNNRIRNDINNIIDIKQDDLNMVKIMVRNDLEKAKDSVSASNSIGSRNECKNENITKSTDVQDHSKKRAEKRHSDPIQHNDNSSNKKFKSWNSRESLADEDITVFDQINEKVNRLVFEVRVKNKSDITKNSYGGKLAEINLEDTHGKPLKCLLYNNVVDQHYNSVEVEREYYLKRVLLSMHHNKDTVSNKYLIILKDTSKIIPIERDPVLSSEFVKLAKINTLPRHSKVDVIGIITKISRPERTSSRSKLKWLVEIRDERRNSCTLTFWKDDAEKFKYKRNDIIAVKGGVIYIYTKTNHISISDSTSVIICNDIKDPKVDRLRGYIRTMRK